MPIGILADITYSKGDGLLHTYVLSHASTQSAFAFVNAFRVYEVTCAALHNNAKMLTFCWYKDKLTNIK